jgi:hypothetical protein
MLYIQTDGSDFPVGGIPETVLTPKGAEEFGFGIPHGGKRTRDLIKEVRSQKAGTDEDEDGDE